MQDILMKKYRMIKMLFNIGVSESNTWLILEGKQNFILQPNPPASTSKGSSSQRLHVGTKIVPLAVLQR